MKPFPVRSKENGRQGIALVADGSWVLVVWSDRRMTLKRASRLEWTAGVSEWPMTDEFHREVVEHDAEIARMAD